MKLPFRQKADSINYVWNLLKIKENEGNMEGSVPRQIISEMKLVLRVKHAKSGPNFHLGPLFTTPIQNPYCN